MSRQLYLGCTKARHARLGVDAVVNARGGLQCLNGLEEDDIDLHRDAQAIRDKKERRIRWYGPQSKFFRRNRARISHLIDSRDD